MNYTTIYKQDKLLIESLLKKSLPTPSNYNRVLIDAMEYSLLAGGKRLRPIIMLETYKLFGKDIKEVESFLIAMEMIHTYSLVHDDLPALDDDALRRGKLTCHMKFGEDIAILAGDALLNYAVEIMVKSLLNSNDQKNILGLNEIIRASGIEGIVTGQVADVLNEDEEVDKERLDYINRHKTSKMLEACFTAGAYIGGVDENIVEKLRQVGKNLGLAFQIQDDILDVTSSEEALGKPINSDVKNKKNTYVSLLGIENAELKMKKLYDEAIKIIKNIDAEKTRFLVELIQEMKTRSY